MPKIALLQMTSGIDPEANAAVICEAIRSANSAEAFLLFAPEMALLLDRNRERASQNVVREDDNQLLTEIAIEAFEQNVDIHFGFPVLLENGMWANRSVLISNGLIHERYDKIHMFDVDLASGESWRESKAYAAGEEVVTVNSPIGTLGLTTCYDVRFPALWDELGRRKCDAIAVPAAFTVPTGQAHWHTLLRARAIEATAFIIAAAQVGKHEDGRETYGHSLVVDPWGEVLLDMGGEGPGLGFCEIDLARVAEVRRQLPSLANKREIPNSSRA